jgi:hypothetical protein
VNVRWSVVKSKVDGEALYKSSEFQYLPGLAPLTRRWAARYLKSCYHLIEEEMGTAPRRVLSETRQCTAAPETHGKAGLAAILQTERKAEDNRPCPL